MIPFRYNLRSLMVRKTSNAFAVFGIAMVVYVLASALMLSAGIKKTLASAGRDDVAVILRKGSETELASNIDDPVVSTLKAQSGVQRENGIPLGFGETVVVVALPKIGVEGVSNVQLRGVMPEATKLRGDVKLIRGRTPKPGSDEVMIGQRLEGRFAGLSLGQSFELKKNRPANVVGVFSANGSAYESEVWVDHDTLRAAFGRQGGVSAVRLKLESASRLAALKSSVEQDKRLGLEVVSERRYFERISEGTSIFVTALGSVIAVFFSLGAMIGAMITMYGAVANRQREIGILRALGFPRGHVLLAFLIESVLIAAVGGLIGCIGATAMGKVEISMMNLQSWSEVVFRFQPTMESLGVALTFALAMGVLGGFLPAFRASRVSALEAMRSA